MAEDKKLEYKLTFVNTKSHYEIAVRYYLLFPHQ